MVPVLLVALGLHLVFRSVGLAPGYVRWSLRRRCFLWPSGGWHARQHAARSPAGNNKARAQVMFITEISTSIQGEGTRSGLPCVFLAAHRLQSSLRGAIPLTHSRREEDEPRMKYARAWMNWPAAGRTACVHRRVLWWSSPGGEPLLQRNYALRQNLLADGYVS